MRFDISCDNLHYENDIVLSEGGRQSTINMSPETIYVQVQALKIGAGLSNLIPHFIMHVITYPYPD